MAIEGIESYVVDTHSLNEYIADRKTKRAVERELAIIGEAAVHLRRIEPLLSLPDAERIASMLNRLVHSYDNIDDPIVWGVLRIHLPALKAEVLRRAR